MTSAAETFEPIKSPFPWFGGKSRAAELIWSRLGDVPNYANRNAANQNARRERIWFSPACIKPEAELF